MGLDDRATRIAFHEAGHAVLHFVLGRPVEYVAAEPTCHETKPVAGTALEEHLEAILWVCGLSAEEEWLREVGRGEDAFGWLPNSGAIGDYQYAETLFEDAQIAEAEKAADQLIKRYWSAVSALAGILLDTPILGQDDIQRVARAHDLTFGEAAY